MELLLQPHDAVTVAAGGSLARLSWRDAQSSEVTPGSTIGELALLQRQHSLLQEELLRLRDAESRFRDSERARTKLERQVRQMKGCSGTSSACQPRDEELRQVRAEHFNTNVALNHVYQSVFLRPLCVRTQIAAILGKKTEPKITCEPTASFSHYNVIVTY